MSSFLKIGQTLASLVRLGNNLFTITVKCSIMLSKNSDNILDGMLFGPQALDDFIPFVITIVVYGLP